MALRHRRSFYDPFQLPKDCRRCRGEGGAALRAEWGCREETDDVQLWIPCLCGRTAKCRVCDDLGFVAIHRCPQKLVGPDERELLALHRQWPDTLPYAGGLYDQPAPYVVAMRLLDYAEGLMVATLRKIEDSGKH